MFTTLFFDLDDTLYPAQNGLWKVMKQRITDYIHTRFGIPAGEAQALSRQYFEQYGTALRGLQANEPSFDTEDFLAYVHDVSLTDFLTPNPRLNTVLQALPARKWIFTNADLNHAQRVLKVLGLTGYFEGIVDVNAIHPYCKPMPQAFAAALRLAGDPDPRRCAMIDDLPRTTRAARALGIFSILYGESAPHPDADATLADWEQLPALLHGGTP